MSEQKDKTTFLGNTDFLDKVKELFKNKKFWAPALAATLGAGAIGGVSAGLSHRDKETPRQRRRRILRSILVPSLLTAGAAGLGGLGAATLNMEDFRWGDKNLAKKEKEFMTNQEEKEKENEKTLNTVKEVIGNNIGTGTGAALGGYITHKGQGWLADIYKDIKARTNDNLKNSKPLNKHDLSMLERKQRLGSKKAKRFTKKLLSALGKKFKKVPFAGHIIEGSKIPAAVTKAVTFSKIPGNIAGAYVGAQAGDSAQRLVQSLTNEETALPTEEQLRSLTGK